MNPLIWSLPFVAAIGLLVTGVVRIRRFLFFASFAVLFGACYLALVADGTMACGFMGSWVMLFGLTGNVLSHFLQQGAFVSRDELRLIGNLFIVLGFLISMIL